jgi:hypothetical protein
MDRGRPKLEDNAKRQRLGGYTVSPRLARKLEEIWEKREITNHSRDFFEEAAKLWINREKRRMRNERRDHEVSDFV